eukprot:6212248-Prymnesium_polylepis.1
MLRAALLSSFLAAARGALDAITLAPRSRGPRAFVDSAGRERIFHGTNAIVKGPPWHPDSRSFSTDISMSEEDFAWMKALGLNVLRIGIMWPGVEPLRGEYNETYLDEIDKIVTLAAQHGVYTFLDMHQDGLSEHFCGEGLPPWAVQHTKHGWLDKLEDVIIGGEAFPSPFDHFDNATDFYIEPRLPGSPRLPTRTACKTHNLGPGWHEVTKEASNAYQALYSNVGGVADAWAAMWGEVASRFARRPEVLGYELINEPFAGDLYEDPLLMLPYPSPTNADRKNLQPMYDKINSAVRAVDPEALIFFA